MSYIYHSDYTTSDYWDPILYPKVDIYSGLLCDKINKCTKKEKKKVEKITGYSKPSIPVPIPVPVHDKDETFEILYCDLSEVIKQYNEFLKFYTTVFNKIVGKYNEISNAISTMSVKDEMVDSWLRWVDQLRGENIVFQTIIYNPIETNVSELIVCDTVIEILRLIRNDVDNRMKILHKISQFKTVDPTALWNRIYAS